MQECREAMGEPDNAPRKRWVDTAAAAPGDIDERLIAFVLDALGCAGEAVNRTPKAAPVPPELSAWGGSSANWHGSARWQVETTSCTIEIKQTATYFPGDVNEPASSSHWSEVKGARRDQSRAVTMGARIGEHELWILVDAQAKERDQIHTVFWRAFGLPRRW